MALFCYQNWEVPHLCAFICCYSVRQVHDVQLNIMVNGFAGRVHITEVADDFVEVSNK